MTRVTNNQPVINSDEETVNAAVVTKGRGSEKFDTKGFAYVGVNIMTNGVGSPRFLKWSIDRTAITTREQRVPRAIKLPNTMLWAEAKAYLLQNFKVQQPIQGEWPQAYVDFLEAEAKAAGITPAVSDAIAEKPESKSKSKDKIKDKVEEQVVETA